MREILTLQLGPTASYIGTHFWNTQEAYFNYGDSDLEPEFEHDVLFRAGISSLGVETYTPRALIYDLKGGFGSLQKYNKLYSGVDTGVEWDQGVNTISSEIEKHPYQQQLELLEEGRTTLTDAVPQLDQTVTTWSDFNRVYYHPRALNSIATHQADDPLSPFDTYTIGRQAYADNEKEADIFENAFRNMVEECDQLQGFQLFAGVDDAFGGFTEELLNNIRDEFSKSTILTFGVMASDSSGNMRWQQKKSLNRVLSTTRLSSLSSIYIPLYDPTYDCIQACGLASYIRPNCKSLYHTSAILSAAIETVTTPYRLKKTKSRLDELDGLLNWRRDTKLASIGTSFPLPISEHGYNETLVSFDPLLPLLDLSSPGTQKAKEVYGESIVIRGCPSSESSSNYVNQILKSFKEENNPLQTRAFVDSPYPLPDSYPKFFSHMIKPDGTISSSHMNDQQPSTVPMLSYFSTNSNMAHVLQTQLDATKTISLTEYFEYAEGDYGLSRDDFLETKEDMMNLIDVYTPDEK
ncbi:tubulin domain-containing protein [Halteromyces radiatus]|uniref:tubulin domain-containing protein n=1 Tax=Halteromyces radiatus TaxID=101107 RepID=UPI00221FFD51|nr:tubulin domain-containing protein [Halteromyces radiatus]KAI8085008.1 tubulin domain-containing protein [Halteromyces radiatus]